MESVKDELLILNEAVREFLYEDGSIPYVEEFYIFDNFASIILDNKIKLVKQNYHVKVPLKKNIKYTSDFLKTLEKEYNDKLKENLDNDVIKFYQRAKDDTTNASLEVDLENKSSRIVIPYSGNIEDTFTLTHENMHSTNMSPETVNDTTSLFTEMISFLTELLQRDYFENMPNKPKEYRKNMIEAFYATKYYAILMKFNLELIYSYLDKGYIDFNDIRIITRNTPKEHLSMLSEELENILNNEELSFYKYERYVISNVVACYIHDLILNDPKNKNILKEINEILSDNSIEQIFSYLNLDVKDYDTMELTDESYKILRKSYNNEIKRL